jgi:hypothetical protein
MFSCEKPQAFDSSLMTGKWQQGSLFEVYQSDGNGHTWDTTDDVSEEEAQKFRWTLNEAQLVQYHLLEMGGEVPKRYTLTELTSTTLSYHDDYGKKYSFTKK